MNKETENKDKILLVEDNKDTSLILSSLLKKNNFEVKVAENGVKALETKDAEKRELMRLKRIVAERIMEYVGRMTVMLLQSSPMEAEGILEEEELSEYGNTLWEVLEATSSERKAEKFEGLIFEGGKFFFASKRGVLEPVQFSFPLSFRNPDWDLVTKEPFVYTFNYRIGGDNEEVIDVYTNAGYRKIYSELAKKGKSFLVAPSRVPTVALSILDTLAYLYKEKPADKEYQVLVRITDKEVERVIEAIDTQRLRKKGIVLKTFKNHSLLDLEVKKFAHRVKAGQLGMIVIAPAKTIARGVDLSAMDTIVIPGTVQGSGKDFTQLTARTFNNTDRHSSALYVFGTPLRVNYYRIRGKDYAEASPNYTSLVQAKLLKKYEFIKAMMSGELVNVLERTEPVVVPLISLWEEENLRQERKIA